MKVFNRASTAAVDATKHIGVPPAALEPRPADHELGRGLSLPSPPWYRRPGLLIAAAVLTAEIGIVVSGPGEPGTAPGGTIGTSTARSPSFSLIGTGWWTPDPTAPPAAAPPVVIPAPPPPSQLVLRFDNSLMAFFVSITNNADKPAVSCMYRSVAVAGPAATVNYDHSDSFTVIGSAETRIDYEGPATGSTFHKTVTCDDGLSTSQDIVY
jgi:hypothetical protein